MKKKILNISILLNVVLVIVILLLGVKFNLFSKIVNKFIKSNTAPSILEDKYYLNKVDIFKSLPNSENEVIFVGDSITDMGEWDELFSNVNTINRGISSDTTEGVINRLDEIIESNPKKIFLMVGINDIGNGLGTKQISDNYLSIIKYIKNHSPNTSVYIQSVLPCNSNLMEDNNRNAKRTTENISELNSSLKSITESENVTYVDLYSLFLKDGEMNENYTSDGIHLSGKGYSVWKENIEQYFSN